LKVMPVHLLHGRLDWICRPESAWAVHQALPHSQLQWVDNAGHNMFEPLMTQALVQAIEAATLSHR
jgi:proline iminopeptidase